MANTESRSSTGWHPILEGVAAIRARETVEAIAADLLLQSQATESADNVTLAGGSAGLALAHAYLSQCGFGEAHKAAAIGLLNRSVEGLAGGWLPAGLHEGFTGIAWAAEHLDSRLFDPDGEDSNEPIDDALEICVERPPRTGDFELLIGLSGLGVYALERLPRPSATRHLGRIVDRLDDLAVNHPDGIAWMSDGARSPLKSADSSRGEPYYNLGLAHGIPGAIAFLAQAYAAGIARRKSARLLEGAISWFLGRELPAGRAARFPTAVRDGVDPGGSRLAWCYGDAGIAAALMAAALHTGETRWEKKASRIALAAANRSFESAGVADAGLCHGAAGLAHIFNRLYAATGEPALAQASRRWFSAALDMRSPGSGIGGYLSWEPVDEDRREWVATTGFLSGAAGIALALLGAITHVEPAWDRILLTNLPTTAKE